MKSKIYVILFFVSIALCCMLSAAVFLAHLSKEDVLLKITSTPETKQTHWVAIEPTFTPAFYKTKDAKRIGDNVLLFQSPYGGWDKNIHMDANLDIFEKLYVFCDKSLHETPTIDNTATTTEIDYLSKLYNATNVRKYKQAVIRGIEYLLNMQMDNGGFPQSFPFALRRYQKHITYNDKAMINVLSLFYKIINDDPQYKFLSPHLKKRVTESFDKGLNCLLKTQLPSGGWAAQYDYETMKPARGRMYELASIDSRETANNLIFLMTIKNPSEDIVQSIEKAANWLDSYKIENLEMVTYTKDSGKEDLKTVYCEECSPIWARMYDVTTNTPVFSDRSGLVFKSMEGISHERRNNYEWYVIDGRQALEEYEIWKLSREQP